VTPANRVLQYNLTASYGELIGVRAFSDLHLDESLVRWGDLKRLADHDAARGVKYALGIGDIANLVFPTDLKRFRQSVLPKQLQGRDAWMDETIDYVANKLRELGYTWIMLTPGNHEDEILKRHGVNVTKILTEKLGCMYGGYSGVLDIRHTFTSRKQTPVGNATVRILWHHGAWGGRLAKGYNGAWPYFAQHDHWHFALYGHNHAARHDTEIRCRVMGSRLVQYRCHLVNLSSAVAAYSDDASITHYAERHGYLRTPCAPAVLWWKIVRPHRKPSCDQHTEILTHVEQ